MPPEGSNGVCNATEDAIKSVDDSSSASETQRLMVTDPGNNTSEGRGGDVSKARRTTLSLIKLLVFLDMFSVSLVVPLLSAYFRDLNISTELYGLMSSVYSLAQIVGGLVLAALSDRVMSRRSVLLISFVGSCVSYGMVGLSRSLSMLVLGRVVVGLVKQTMTMSTAIVTENTTTENRSEEFSRLSAARTFSGIVGPSLGSFLYQRNMKLPPLVASGLFLVNTVLLLVFLPAGGRAVAFRNKKTDDDGKNGQINNGKPQTSDTDGKSAWTRFADKFRRACRDSGTLRILLARLVYGFFMRSLAGRHFVGYFEERFGVESSVQGYVFSYRAGLGFLVELYAIGPILSRASETTVVWCALATVTLTNLAEAASTLVGFQAYLALVVPASVVANAALGACLQSIFTQRVPQSDLGAALGTLDVLLSASGVVGPLYGAKIMGTLGVLRRPAVTSAHYAAFCALWWFMEVRRGGSRRKVVGGVGGDEDGPRPKVE